MFLTAKIMQQTYKDRKRNNSQQKNKKKEFPPIYGYLTTGKL